jgi:hypothetical protein
MKIVRMKPRNTFKSLITPSDGMAKGPDLKILGIIANWHGMISTKKFLKQR